MKKLYTLVTLSTALCIGSVASAQTFKNKEGGHIEFTVVKDHDKTAVDNQYKTSTCWSFSSLSFFESELIRQGKKAINLSEMFVVNQTYRAKAEKYVRMHGSVKFGPGGAFHDALYVMKNFGMVPQEVYSGKLVDKKNHMHNEMDAVLEGIVKAIVRHPNGVVSPVWQMAFGAAIDAYLGELPTKFNYEGKEYTPKSFQSSMGVNPDDYVIVTSFTHHDWYKPFVLEVEDNWAAQSCYNVPLEDLQKTMTHAIDNGFTFAWAADVSEKGFNWKNSVAIIPEGGWDQYSRRDIDSLTNYPVAQLKPTQEERQLEFDNYETQDDHGMHITGIVKDQNGTKYYKVKNSWGTSNDCDGYLYASEAYVLMKTTNIMLHKDALPKDIRKKLGIN